MAIRFPGSLSCNPSKPITDGTSPLDHSPTPRTVGQQSISDDLDMLVLGEEQTHTDQEDHNSSTNTGIASPQWPDTGQLPFCVRELLKCGDHFWATSGWSFGSGHQFLALNSLGYSISTPNAIATDVMNDLGAVFPGGASGRYGQRVFVGNVFALGTKFFDLTPMRFRTPLPLRFLVKVISVDAWSFTLKTKWWHPFRGIARHGIVKDLSGELWMLQEGRGEPHKEKPWQFAFNYALGELQWRNMAENTRRLYVSV